MWNNLTEYLRTLTTDEELIARWKKTTLPVKKKILSETKMKKMKKTDPNAPKRPKSAYMFFCADYRLQIKESDPTMKATDVMKQLGKYWKNLDSEQSDIYSQKSKNDKQRYETEMQQWDS